MEVVETLAAESTEPPNPDVEAMRRQVEEQAQMLDTQREYIKELETLLMSKDAPPAKPKFCFVAETIAWILRFVLIVFGYI